MFDDHNYNIPSLSTNGIVLKVSSGMILSHAKESTRWEDHASSSKSIYSRYSERSSEARDVKEHFFVRLCGTSLNRWEALILPTEEKTAFGYLHKYIYIAFVSPDPVRRKLEILIRDGRRERGKDDIASSIFSTRPVYACPSSKESAK